VIGELVGGAVTRTYAYGLQRISENQKIGSALRVYAELQDKSEWRSDCSLYYSYLSGAIGPRPLTTRTPQGFPC
jgi:hypothetical protein